MLVFPSWFEGKTSWRLSTVKSCKNPVWKNPRTKFLLGQAAVFRPCDMQIPTRPQSRWWSLKAFSSGSKIRPLVCCYRSRLAHRIDRSYFYEHEDLHFIWDGSVVQGTEACSAYPARYSRILCPSWKLQPSINFSAIAGLCFQAFNQTELCRNVRVTDIFVPPSCNSPGHTKLRFWLSDSERKCECLTRFMNILIIIEF